MYNYLAELINLINEKEEDLKTALHTRFALLLAITTTAFRRPFQSAKTSIARRSF